MRTQLTRLRAALVLLLVSSGLLFAIGSTIERHQHHSEPHPSAAASTERSRSAYSDRDDLESEARFWGILHGTWQRRARLLQ